MTKVSQRKQRQFSNIPHEQIELQPLTEALDAESATITPDVSFEKETYNLLNLENILIPFCYLTVGLCQGLNRPLLNVYPLDLGATEAQQATLGLVVMIPATLKIVFGFLSDNFPIFGYRRKSYMFIGWISVSIVMIWLYHSTDLSMQYDLLSGRAIPPIEAPSIAFVSLSFLLFGTGMWMADVMGDSIVAEKARLEPEDAKGRLQSTCYACRFFGIMIAAPTSSFLYTYYGPGAVVLLLSFTPLPMLPLLYLYPEDRNAKFQSTKEQCKEIFNTCCSRAVWQPIGFLFLFNLLQVQNAAWRQYLSSVLGFSSQQLNSLLVASYIFLFLGTLCYKFYFLQTSWRLVYQFCILVNGLLTAMQLLLIKQKTFGLSNYWFALGDDAAAEFVQGVQFLPGSIMMVNLCPPGSEGASYALFTTAWNLAILLAPSISSTLLSIWDVSVAALKAGNLDGLFNLSILTAVIQTSPIFLLPMLPQTRDELLGLASKPMGRSVLGGTVFLLIMFASMSYIITVGILNIVKPGWAGES